MCCYSLRICIFVSTILMGASAGAADAGVTSFETEALDAGNLAESIDAGLSSDPVSIDATVTILSPSEGEALEGPWIEIAFQIQGCQINGPNQDPTGCHLHKVLDGAIYQDPEGGGTGHYNPTPLQMYVGNPGSHVLKLILVRNDGTDLPYEPEVGHSVTVNVDIEATESEVEEAEEEDEEPYVAPIREKSEGGCRCEASSLTTTPTPAFAFLLLGFWAWRRRFF